ncbi:MAG: hypothetical protein LBR77_00505 [Lachnospiraceae bacterium]|jgi:hypothetical protein|nr:hypothetical protein [Lachnospiraceae bacterium]
MERAGFAGFGRVKRVAAAWAVTAAVCAVSMAVAGCSAADKVKDVYSDAQDALGVGPVSEETKYANLNHMISNPKDLDKEYHYDGITGTFSFYAMAYTARDEMELEELDEPYAYQLGWISRNAETPFFLNVSKLDGEIPIDTVVEITGEIAGTIYWSEDNQQVEMLDLTVESYKEVPDDGFETDESNVIELGSGATAGKLEFIGAHLTRDTFTPVVVIYFNYTNTSDGENRPTMTDLFIYQGEDESETTIFDLDEVAGAALSTRDGRNTTYPGKTQLYYYAVKTAEDIQGEPVIIERYDDAFHVANRVTLQVEPTLDALVKGAGAGKLQ